MAEELSNHIPFWTGEGYCLAGDSSIKEGDRYRQSKIEFNLPKQVNADDEPVSRMGKLVTKSAANSMHRDYIQAVNTILDKTNISKDDRDALKKMITVQVMFGKEALMFLLAQANCEGIRFYSCFSPEALPSLLLVGVDKNKGDLGTEPNGTIIEKSEITIQFDSTEIDPAKIIVERQKTAIVEVGGTDNKDKSFDSIQDKVVVSLFDIDPS